VDIVPWRYWLFEAKWRLNHATRGVKTYPVVGLTVGVVCLTSKSVAPGFSKIRILLVIIASTVNMWSIDGTNGCRLLRLVWARGGSSVHECMNSREMETFLTQVRNILEQYDSLSVVSTKRALPLPVFCLSRFCLAPSCLVCPSSHVHLRHHHQQDCDSMRINHIISFLLFKISVILPA
jgi:hypothetical protein